MSRRKKNLRTFLYKNKNPTIEEVWDCAWECAQKLYHTKRMAELEAEILRLRKKISQDHFRGVTEMDTGDDREEEMK